METGQLEICIVGAGPRGLSVLERLCACERKSPSADRVTVHLVDPDSPGPGRVWRTGQSGVLLMNTVASQVTVFTDDSVEIGGPIEEGPSLYEWARSLAVHGAAGGCSAETLAEARRLGPDSYPTRAFYGHYLEWCYRRIVAGAPDHLAIRPWRLRAVALWDGEEGPGGSQTVRLADGSRLTGLSAVVLAQGHVDVVPSAAEQRLGAFAGRHGLRYVPPANPADLDLSAVAPGETVLLRGLGLNFFDHMALFTIGRGGTFERVEDRLVYRPSGREPRMYAGSRRGVPYHARGENEKGPHGRYLPKLLTVGWIEARRARSSAGEPAVFRTELWPLIAKEVQSVYYAALLADCQPDADAADFTERYLATADEAAEQALLDAVGIPAADRWDWAWIARPYGDRRFTGLADFQSWLLDHLDRDVREARAGNVSGPLKAALDVLRDLRNEVRLAVDHGGLDGDSHRDDLDGWYTPLNAFLSIGPPVSRIEEMIALINAGVLTVIGPGLAVDTEEDGTQPPAFVATCDIPGVTVRASVLIEARLPEPDLRRTADPLLRQLMESGQCRPYRIRSAGGGEYETGGLAVSERPYHLIDAAGRRHPRRFAYGVPTESVHWVTAAGIRPGVGSVTLADSDAIARTVLALPPVTEREAVPGGGRTEVAR
ncbi:FAD/NAD(P)-binding protein [Streptantibioticus rubrisoli]|uniref:FAD/NAD(P)-binding protein n=1 Tax=Streptantibioticus rubrisoli TaxID=1387313 RepID=A0ABT1PGM9_9ACTN|nr:FAD/NAD(P)-binding protein [Streptantibioticus rubrisoli]MCQ4044510.1 FAD/NAD(P)-binding protein [Streptantibioticus rubrisoli]